MEDSNGICASLVPMDGIFQAYIFRLRISELSNISPFVCYLGDWHAAFLSNNRPFDRSTAQNHPGINKMFIYKL